MNDIKSDSRWIDKIYWNKFTQKIWRLIPDQLFVKLLYLRTKKKWLNLNNPIGYDQKIIAWKLKNRNPMTTICADKYLVRDYVTKKVGSEILIDLLGVYDKGEDVEIDKLPEKFVLKANHGSQMNILCTDKASYNWKNEIKKMNKWLKTNYYWVSREWQYKNIEPKIVCEEFLESKNGEEILDYRFFCFNGEPTLIAIDLDKYGEYQRNLYDIEFQKLNGKLHYDTNSEIELKKPEKFDEMLNIVRKLSEDFQQVRVDLYYANNKIYFGELTFCHAGGGQKFSPESLNIELGEMIKV